MKGGRKGIYFYLPQQIDIYSEKSLNDAFYLYRVLYLCYHYLLDLTSPDHGLSSEMIIETLEKDFPRATEIRLRLMDGLPDMSWLTETFIPNDQASPELETGPATFASSVQKEQEISTELKSKAVESVSVLQVDRQKQEEYMLTHNFEKVETAEEFDGVWRDFDGGDSLQEDMEALDELNLKHVVRVDDIVHSIYKAEYNGQFTVAECKELKQSDHFYPYPEWDYVQKKYLPDYCKVFPVLFKSVRSTTGGQMIRDCHRQISILKKELSKFYNQWTQVRRMNHGDEFDIDALHDMHIDLQAGIQADDKIYLSKRRNRKDLSILFLIDISLSSDSYINNEKVLDIEKRAILSMGEALSDFELDFQVDAYFSKTRNFCTYVTLKHFKQSWRSTIQSIGAIQAQGFTRIGPALRHSSTLLQKSRARSKWLIVLTDGKPTDYDKYEGKHGMEDIKQALKEMKQKQIQYHAVAIEDTAKFYLPMMFGRQHFSIVTHAEKLSFVLQQLYQKIAQSQ